MPAVLVTELRYSKEKDKFSVYLYQLSNRLQVLRAGHYLFGKLEFAKIDKKINKEIGNEIKLLIENSEGTFTFDSDQILRNLGITPNSWVCLVLESYSTTTAKYAPKYPIYLDYFEIVEVPDALKEEVETRFKGAEEVIRLIELTGIAEELKKPYEFLKEAYVKFKINFFADSKTSARKALEHIKTSVRTWKSVDKSEHLAEGTKSFVNSLYSLSSSGGPHEGIASLDETEVILNSTLYLFKYVNKLVKEGRLELKQTEQIETGSNETIKTKTQDPVP